MNSQAAILRAVRERKSGFALKREFYTGKRVFELDLEAIFHREWIFAGHDSELPRAGSYLTLQVGAYPILIVRDRDGTLRAFHNSCRHRGSRICSQPTGSAIRLVCPYHQWTYSLDGSLFSARHIGGAAKRRVCRVPCTSRPMVSAAPRACRCWTMPSAIRSPDGPRCGAR